MDYNVGPNERILRISLGTAAGALALCTRAGLLRLPLAALSVAWIWTGITRRCPMNEALGFRSPLGLEGKRRRKEERLEAAPERPEKAEAKGGSAVEVSPAPAAAVEAPPQD